MSSYYDGVDLSDVLMLKVIRICSEVVGVEASDLVGLVHSRGVVEKEILVIESGIGLFLLLANHIPVGCLRRGVKDD